MKPMRIPFVVLCLALVGCVSTSTGLRRAAIPAGSHYVAMGSSFAAGPGIATIEAGTPSRCTRSIENYAHQLAARRALALTDVTCSGAKTEHLLEAWRELPAQLDALRADTRLVTVTVGGNDLGYMAGLVSASCANLQLQSRFPSMSCRSPAAPDESSFTALGLRLEKIAQEVRRRSPEAMLVFVDYATVMPTRGGCDAMPLTANDATTLRLVDRRLRVLTEKVARQNGAQLLKAGALTRDHHVCAKDPWMNGFAVDDKGLRTAVYHPKLAGMTAVAEALDRLLPR